MSELAETITVDEIARARGAAAAARRRVVDVLEEQLALEPDSFTARLAATLSLERLDMAGLRGAAPQFDSLSFAECSQRGCALLRAEDGRLVLAFDDPFSGELQAWAEERIAQAFSWCLVHRGDLVAFLAAQEESMRALDSLEPERIFDLRWAAALVEHALRRLREECAGKGRLRLFEALRDHLTAERADTSYADLGAALAVADTVVKKQLHNLRQRYRSILREEVAHTVENPADVDDEIRHLCATLAAAA